MAGGSGKRFWPLSRRNLPKQFLKILGDKILLQQTVNRLLPLVPLQQIFIITTGLQKILIRKFLPKFPEKNVLVEPVGRDTAPCAGLGAAYACAMNPGSIQVLLPADHFIKKESSFRSVLTNTIRAAETSYGLITIGIPPTRSETGYGYIESRQNRLKGFAGEVYRVARFHEKPDEGTAKRYLRSKRFYWNSGMFIWKSSEILNEFHRQMPQFGQALEKACAGLRSKRQETVIQSLYKEAPKISIDYAIMEKAERVFMVKGDFGWSDVGSWEEVYLQERKDKKKNVIKGSALLHDSSGNLIIGGDRLIAGTGLKDMVVIDTGDALLILPRSEVQAIKSLVEQLEKEKRNKYL